MKFMNLLFLQKSDNPLITQHTIYLFIIGMLLCINITKYYYQYLILQYYPLRV